MKKLTAYFSKTALAIALGGMVCASQVAFAEESNLKAQLDNIYAQLDAKNYDQYFSALKGLESTNDGKVLLELGWAYENGYGVKADYAKAMEYYQKASANGNPLGTNNIGALYELGRGVKQDYKKAFEYYLKAAEQGNPQAMNNLGYLYSNGDGVKQDYKKAAEWQQKSADKGFAKGELALGWHYETGKGVQQDYKKAIEYYQKSAEKGNAQAMKSLGWLYESGEGVAQDYKKAVNYYQKAVAKGNIDAMNNLAWLYEKGNGVEQSYTKALDLYKQAAEKGNGKALNIVGWFYDKGRGVKQDYKKAAEYYAKGVEKDNSGSMVNLAKLYLNGTGVKQDKTKAIQLLERAEAKNNEYALEELIKVYGKDKDVQDVDKALDYLVKYQGNIGLNESLPEELAEIGNHVSFPIHSKTETLKDKPNVQPGSKLEKLTQSLRYAYQNETDKAESLWDELVQQNHGLTALMIGAASVNGDEELHIKKDEKRAKAYFSQLKKNPYWNGFVQSMCKEVLQSKKDAEDQKMKALLCN